ncbi:MAG: autotransporter-associated beta strand repeat-containing protein, partial [Candidatus Accumulibacter sp.]|nr:autotransporter-associated beta strand repeat-containing protein [Accumulibacter sp.]
MLLHTHTHTHTRHPSDRPSLSRAAILVAALFAAPSAYAACTVDAPVSSDVFGSVGNSTSCTTNTGVFSGQTLNIEATVTGRAYGAREQVGDHDVTGNTVNINSGVTGNVTGGSANKGATDHNTVILNTGGTANSIDGGSSSYGDATDNVVYVHGTVNGFVVGGLATLGETAASDNTVYVMSGGSIGGDVTGGSGYSATHNTVDLEGGTLNGNVYGGDYGLTGVGYAGAPAATDNIVTIGGNVVFGANTNLYGGYLYYASGDNFTGNTLNKKHAATLVQSTRNFQSINFGYSGLANLGTLDTTPTGSSASGVTIDTKTNTVDLNGVVTGTGGIVKIGSGTLTLSGANDYTGDT